MMTMQSTGTRRSWTGSGSFSVAGPCTHSGHRADRGGDALGLILGQRVVLVEAKAHRDEVRSLSRAGAESRSKIEAAFRELAGTWRISDTSAWLTTYYQYANRLAHAFLLNELNAIPTLLVFVHFVGAHEVEGPATRVEWQALLQDMHHALGVHDRLQAYVRDVFVDVSGEVPAVC